MEERAACLSATTAIPGGGSQRRAWGGQSKERGRGGGVLIVINGRSSMTIDPRIPTMPGDGEHVGCSPTRQTLLAPSTKRRGAFGESYEPRVAFYL